MKTLVGVLKYTLLIGFVCLVSCKDSATTSDMIRWDGSSADLSEMEIYIGRSTGGVKVDIKDLIKPGTHKDSIAIAVDKFRADMFKRTLGKIYDKSKHANFRVEYLEDDLLLYVAAGRQGISTYRFSGDSLLVDATEGKSYFLAWGNKEELYKLDGLYRYPVTARRDTVRMIADTAVTLEYVLKQYKKGNLSEMTRTTDTLVLCNAKYKFKK